MKNLEKKNLPYGRFFIGLTFALSLVLVAFEWRTSFQISAVPPGNSDEKPFFTEDPPIYIIPKIKDPAEKKQEKKSIASIPASNKLELVDNNINVIEKPILPDPVEIKPILPDENLPAERDIFIPVEQMPVFPGGEIALLKFLKKNVNYPKMSKELGITGMVFVEFIVETDGSVSNIKIAKGVSSDIDKEAIRVIGLMPKWVPGSQRNQPVQVGIRLPIRFTLM